MPMDTSLAPFGQVLRKLCLFKPLQSQEPLPGHCWSMALSRDNAQFKLAYLLADTSKWGVLEHSKILTPWATHSSWPYPHASYFPWVEGVPNARARTHTRITWAFSPSVPQSPGCHSGVPLVPMVFQASFLERCATSLLPMVFGHSL
jgi:hypothetical protein